MELQKTKQKFAWVLEELQNNPALKNMRVAFLIDEAHRSQEGQMGAAIRLPFRRTDEPDIDDAEQDLEEHIAQVIREHDLERARIQSSSDRSRARPPG